MSAASASPSRERHALTAHEVLLVLGADAEHGLSEHEASVRLAEFGPNRLPPSHRVSRPVRLLRQLQNPLIYVLLVAGVVTLALGQLVECVVIVGVVVVNAAAGYIQESRAEAALDALRVMVRTSARVLRSGHAAVVDSEELVPGDIVMIEAGDKVPADLRLLAETDLEADESALTGEAQPVVKDEVTLTPETVVADRRNMLYSGTLVTRGTGTGVVVATGAETELGQIHRLVGSVDPLATPLTRRLAHFSRVLTFVIIGLAAATFAVGIGRGEPWPEMFTAAVALAVGAIPEGLPAAVTITLAIGVGRMAQRRAIVRRLPAVETLGSTTVVCTDKTGTLTTNRMSVVEVWTPSGSYRLDDTGVGASAGDTSRAGPLHTVLEAAVRCSDAHESEVDGVRRLIGDPTETCLLEARSRLAGRDTDTARWRRVDTLPFESEQRYMAVRLSDGTSDRVLVKGAVERVLGFCALERDVDGAPAPVDDDRLAAEVERLAQRGLRVIAVARSSHDEPHHRSDDLPFVVPADLELLGLVGMHDPPRPEASAAVAACRTAGIDVKMVTGDHASTAVSVAQAVGLFEGPTTSEVMTGSELASMSDSELAARVGRTGVFARISPAQKLRLVEALQGEGQVVAMTGDGVNDAPALRQADIGVAMGRGGTEVAKEAADMVLTDDNFSSIEAAVEEGRGVFDNVVKFIVWTLPTNMGEGLVVLAAVIAGATLPVLPVQILWINMTTAVLLGLMLAFEPREAGIMRRPPHDPGAPLLSRALVERVLLVSTVLVVGTWWVFQWQLAEGSSVESARTAAVNLFVVVEAFYLLNCRSLSSSVWSVGWLSNRWVVGGLLAQAVGQLLITYLPVMNTLFGTAPIDAAAWLRILLVGGLAWLVVTADKWLRRPSF